MDLGNKNGTSYIMTKIKNLCLCGGGIFGYGEVGALTVIEEYSDYFDFTDIYGVSVGSIIAALYAAGYTAKELSQILFDFNFDSLIRGGAILPYLRFYERFGLYDAQELEKEIEKLISYKTNIKYCTFSQLRKNLVIVTTNLNLQRPRLFSKDLSPDVAISKAVRMSISYPGIITPVSFEGDLYGDGGETINYPIILVNNLRESIGITFSSYYENDDGTLRHRIPINSIYDYIRSLALTITRTTYVSQIMPEHLDRSIIIKITQNINSMQFNLSQEQKQFIYECGMKSAREQLPKIIGIKK